MHQQKGTNRAGTDAADFSDLPNSASVTALLSDLAPFLPAAERPPPYVLKNPDGHALQRWLQNSGLRENAQSSLLAVADMAAPREILTRLVADIGKKEEALEHAVLALFAHEPSDFCGALTNCRRELKQYEAMLSRMRGNEGFRTLLEKLPESSEFCDMLAQAGITITQSAQVCEEPGGAGQEAKAENPFAATDLSASPLMNVVSTLQRFPSGKLAVLHEMISSLGELYKKGGVAAVIAYRSGFILEFAQALSDAGAEDVSSGFQVSPMILRQIVSHDSAEMAHARCKPLEAVLLEILKLRGGADLIETMPYNGVAHREYAEDLLAGAKTVIESGGKLKVLARLLSLADAPAKDEVFVRTKQDPRILQLWLRGQIMTPQLVDFVIEYSRLRLPNAIPAERTLLDEVLGIIPKPAGKPIAALLSNEGTQLFFDPGYPVLRRAIGVCLCADRLVLDYWQAVKESKPNLRAILLRVAELRPSAAELSCARNALAKRDDASIGGILSAGSIREMIDLLNAPSKPRPAEEGHTVVPKQNWLRRMLSGLAEKYPAEQHGAKLDAIKNAHELLGGKFEHRLRQVWQDSPEQLFEFAQNVVDLAGTAAFECILRDSALFDAYIMHLQKLPLFTCGRLEDFRDSPPRNFYRELREWLLAEDDSDENRMPAQCSRQLEPVRRPVSRGNVERVIIWGREYPQVQQDKVTQAFPDVRIEFRPELSYASPRLGDLIVCVTSHLAHKTYYTVKSECQRRGVDFLHLRQSGYEALRSLLDGVLA